MKNQIVSARVPGKDGADDLYCEVSIPMPETIEEAVQAYGEEAVLSNALAHWRVTLQAAIRSGLKRGETPEQIQERLANAKMGVKVRGAQVDPMQAFLAKFKSATPEEREQLLQMLQESAAE